jgi:uridine kinase
MDGFHHRAARRHRRGRRSADGYYTDAYDTAALRRCVLDPLGPGGDGWYRGAVHDLATDEVLDAPATHLGADGVVVVDGTFLQRPELAGRFDVVVWVDTPWDVARRRGATRDAALFGGYDTALDLYDQRYHAACRRYLAEVPAAERADAVVHNADPAHPTLVLRRRP